MKWVLGGVVATVVALGAGCGSPAGPSAVGLDQLLARLRGTGAQVAVGGSLADGAFEVPGVTLIVDGEDVQAYAFPDEATAAAAARTVAPSGGSVGTRSFLWLAPVSFYRLGPVIVLYVGRSTAVRGRLGAALGAPFAGSAALAPLPVAVATGLGAVATDRHVTPAPRAVAAVVEEHAPSGPRCVARRGC